MKISNILNTDSYKSSHWSQYPPGSMFVESYIESRGGEFEYTLFNGLQGYIKENLLTPITSKDVFEAEDVFKAHMPGVSFNRDGWLRIVNHYNGFLPLEIKAVKEGSKVPTKNVLVTVRNTDSYLPWLTSYVETALLRAIWYPTTVATISREIRKVIFAALVKTGGYEGIDFKLHDFGARGVSSLESAGIGGTAHLINFQGTDNVPALIYAKRNYAIDMAGYSIAAAEHSTITSWGKAHEISAYDNMINQFGKPGAMFAVVSDSYDPWNACSNLWGEALRAKVVGSGATLVVRPDSGKPAEIVLKTLRLLDEKFGHVINSNGYKVLKNVRVIQGDGINLESIKEILAVFISAGYSAENVAFGMGGALLQHMNRDTLRFAMKASSITIFDEKSGQVEEREVFKSPSTDFLKASKKGRQMLYTDGKGDYFTAQVGSPLAAGMKEALETVYVNGKLIRNQSLTEIRQIANE